MKLFGPIALLCMTLAPWGAIRANSLVFTWAGSYSTGGQTHELDGQATFDTVSDGSGAYNLVITLINMSPDPAAGTDWLLGGLYFNILQGATSGTGGTSPGALTPISATAYELATVSQVNKNSPYTVTYSSGGDNICANAHPGFYGCSGNTVSGGWEAAYSSPGFSSGQHWAIGTARQGVFKGNNTGGINYAITPTSGINAAAWSADSSPYAFGSATFTLRGLSSSAIFVSQVAATYGTGPSTTLNGALFPGEVPETKTVVMMAAGTLLLAALKRRHRP